MDSGGTRLISYPVPQISKGKSEEQEKSNSFMVFGSLTSILWCNSLYRTGFNSPEQSLPIKSAHFYEKQS